jgi:acetylornithine/N-succinyldiaminopimelate aminotransferase
MHNQAIPTLLPVYQRADVAFERGQGSWLYDREGRRWLDMASGVAVTALGHAHPHLVRAVQEQAAKLWHVSNIVRIPELERLADRLVAATFADTCFVCNSGAEALECAIKMARRHWHALGEPERHQIVTFEGAFHGRTMATVSAAGGKKLVDGFAPLLPGFDLVPFGDHDAFRSAVGPQTAAVLIEPIQGEGGIRVVPDQCLRGIRQLCNETGALLILDEVQTGMGRTGSLFYHEQVGIAPDVMASAKGLGGGFPVGACLATARAASGMTAGTHGSTYGGNPLACAVADAVLDVMLEEGFMDRVRERGEQLRAGLESLREQYPSAIAEVRGHGLLVGLRVEAPNAEFAARLRDHGVISVGASDNVVRLLPPLTVSEEEIDIGLEAVAAVCRDLAQDGRAGGG